MKSDPSTRGDAANPSGRGSGYWVIPCGTAFRKVMFQVHLWLGVALGVYLLVIGLTGSLVVFRGEIEDALRPRLTRVVPGTARALIQTMLEAARAAHPGARFHTLNLPTGPDRSLSFWGHDAENRSFHAYFDPWTGNLLGNDLAGDNATEWIYELHANLLGGPTGEKINGIGALLFVVLCVSGIVVWWPGRGLVRRQGLTIQWQSGWKRVNYDLHKVTGIVSAALLLLTAVTGIWFPFKAPFRWAVEKMTDTSADEDSPSPAPSKIGPWVSLDVALAAVSSVLPDSAPNWVGLPEKEGDVYSVRKRLPGEWRLDGMNHIHVDASSGQVLRVDLHSERTTAQRILRSFFPLHTGTFGGLPTRILWVVVGLSPVLLGVSGYLMWWNRVVRKRIHFQ